MLLNKYLICDRYFWLKFLFHLNNDLSCIFWFYEVTLIISRNRWVQFECQRAARQHESQLFSFFLNAGELLNSSVTRAGFLGFVLECLLYIASSTLLPQVYPYLEFFKQYQYCQRFVLCKQMRYCICFLLQICQVTLPGKICITIYLFFSYKQCIFLGWL